MRPALHGHGPSSPAAPPWTREPDGADQAWTYDGEGNCVHYRNALGGVTTYEYSHFDVLTALNGPDGARHEFGYDAELRLLSFTNPRGLTWTYEHDAAGRTVAETDFDGRTIRYTHDAAGRAVSRENAAGQVTRYEYDALDNRTLKNSEGVVTRYEYDYPTGWRPSRPRHGTRPHPRRGGTRPRGDGQRPRNHPQL
ncbi:hypothetical protein [Streptomyces sp. NPDC058861]|uniref:hypothetical protein n=1 Tax=Streptomyces sp. NPDC058861 TaxID=3346653 RepID=UPI0036CA3BFA